MAAFHCEDCVNNDCGNCVINHDNENLDFYPGLEEDTIYDEDEPLDFYPGLDED